MIYVSATQVSFLTCLNIILIIEDINIFFVKLITELDHCESRR